MHRGKDIVLLKKPVRGKRVWYFYYYYTELNYYKSNRYSVGLEVDDNDLIKSERKALREAKRLQYIKEIERSDKSNKELFSNYAQDWFLWDKCPYLIAERRRGKSPSHSYADGNRRNLENNILPYFGKMKISEIRPVDIETWMFQLQNRELSGRTINLYYNTLQIILGEATRLGDLTVNPGLNVKRMAEKKKVREILTMDEFNLLFKDDALEKVWNNEILYYTMTLLGATCGLRVGEIQALLNENVDSDKLLLKIKHSWDRTYGLVTTKTKENRVVPITDGIRKYMQLCQSVNPFGFIFSFSNGKQPVDHKAISKFFKRALVNIGIDEENRTERGLTFHSLRHFATSYFNETLGQQATMNVIGHSTIKMNEHYDHATIERLNKVRDAMEKIS
ncbi:MAG: tyrosine-type recombinase/integrase family protein [Spirochaetales bacterium]|nr:tyrosine-type recombinase/integrase family protein [Spirochaetales bacterium]